MSRRDINVIEVHTRRGRSYVSSGSSQIKRAHLFSRDLTMSSVFDRSTAGNHLHGPPGNSSDLLLPAHTNLRAKNQHLKTKLTQEEAGRYEGYISAPAFASRARTRKPGRQVKRN
jgi:hypothetical protein